MTLLPQLIGSDPGGETMATPGTVSDLAAFRIFVADPLGSQPITLYSYLREQK